LFNKVEVRSTVSKPLQSYIQFHSACGTQQLSWQAYKAIHLQTIRHGTISLSEKDALVAVETAYSKHFHRTADAAAMLNFHKVNPCRADETICYSRVGFGWN
jgi:hypothetical protein